jgi:biopolymer transport protein ExbD
MYREALSVSPRNTTVVLRRTLQEKCVNPYNETLLRAWGANLDIQYIIDVYAVIMYIAAYITKSEKNMGQLLREVAKQCRDEDISIQLKKIGSTFLNKREVSAQEVAYRLLSIPLRKFSRSVVFVNTDKKIERAGKLKSAAQLSNKDDDDEDIFETSLIDRYAARPDSLEKICLATFASQYSTKYEQESGDNDRDDAPRKANDDGDENSQNDRQNCNERIQLKHGLGRMIKRKRECVIRFRRLHREKEPEDFFRAKLFLFRPWRHEESDLLLDFESYESHYAAVQEEIMAEEMKFSQNMEFIDNDLNELNENGPPEQQLHQPLNI